MKFSATVRSAVVLATALVLTSALAASTKDLEALMSKDGLQKISVTGVDLAYARTGGAFFPCIAHERSPSRGLLIARDGGEGVLRKVRFDAGCRGIIPTFPRFFPH